MIWLAPSHIDLPEEAETPCFVVDHAGVRHNLERVAGACGGSDRLVPHIKTHRAPWLVADLLEQGVSAFKAATPAEVEMLAEAGAREIIWAYPSVSVPGMRRVVATANRFPDIRFSGLVGAADEVRLGRYTVVDGETYLTLVSMPYRALIRFLPTCCACDKVYQEQFQCPIGL